AGIVGEDVLVELVETAGRHRTALAQGAVFALKARQRAGNLAEYQDVAARILCGMNAIAAARLADSTLEELTSGPESRQTGAEPLYELWRKRIREHFSSLSATETAAALIPQTSEAFQT